MIPKKYINSVERLFNNLTVIVKIVADLTYIYYFNGKTKVMYNILELKRWYISLHVFYIDFNYLMDINEVKDYLKDFLEEKHNEKITLDFFT